MQAFFNKQQSSQQCGGDKDKKKKGQPTPKDNKSMKSGRCYGPGPLEAHMSPEERAEYFKRAGEAAAWIGGGEALSLRKIGRLFTWIGGLLGLTEETIAYTTVGRWMSAGEYATMVKAEQMIEGAGDQTFVATGGSEAFTAAAKGSVYVEFDVPIQSLLKGGKEGWFKVIGPNAA